MPDEMKPITVLGAGSWGTALALYLARLKQSVNLWSIDPSEIKDIVRAGENKRFMPGFAIPANIMPLENLEEAVRTVQDILMVIPSAGYRHVLTLLKPYLTKHARIICATKGIDATSGQLMHQVTLDVLGERSFAVLSGPSFAKEVAAGLPAAVAIASHDDDFLEDLKHRFHSALFRTTLSHDITGVEIGGVVKNVIAIAVGMSDGLALGVGARSTLITQGLAEIIQLGLALGGKMETLVGLAGLGDLILTCSDDLSRNRRFGLALAKKKTIADAHQEIGQSVEGKQNIGIILKIAKEHHVNMPICSMVSQVIEGQLSPRDSMLAWMDEKIPI